MKSENIEHQCAPISGFDDLARSKDELKMDEKVSISSRNFFTQVATVIMINCGGTIDLLTFFGTGSDILNNIEGNSNMNAFESNSNLSKRVIFVLDSHRPYHLSNVRESNQSVVVLDDSYEYNLSMFPDDAEDSESDSERSGDDEDSWLGENDLLDEDDVPDDHENAINVDVEEKNQKSIEKKRNSNKQTKKRDEKNRIVENIEMHVPEGKEEQDDNEPSRGILEGDEESDGENSSTSKSVLEKRKSPQSTSEQLRPLKRLTKTGFVQKALEKKEREMRRSILREYYRTSFYGSSIALLSYEMAGQLNKQSNHSLWLSILGLTDQVVMERIPFQRYLEAVIYFEADVLKFNPELISIDDENGRERKMNPQHGHISREQEYQCLLLRHWTLFDSLLHSRYVCTRLQLWKSGANEKLKHLLAKMGIPLTEAQGKFAVMDISLKKELREKFVKHAPAYDLQHILYPSFVRRHGDILDMSAADMVYSLSALIENPKAFDLASLESDAQVNSDRLFNSMKQNFWNAFQAISRDEIHLLQQGISEAIRLQEAILRQGRAILEKRDYIAIGSFRYAILKPNVDSSLFAHPVALTKLAHFLMEALASGSDLKLKHFVACSMNETRQTYMVVGVSSAFQTSQAIDDIYHNNFGRAFRESAEQTDTRFKHDGFDRSVIEVHVQDLDRFLDLLHSGLIEI